MKANYSLKRRITLRLLSWLTLLLLCSSVLVYFDAREEVEELFDASLAQSARVLHGLVTLKSINENKQDLLDSLNVKDANINKFVGAATPHGHKYEKKLFFQVFGEDKKLLIKSSSMHGQPPNEFKRGFHESEVDGYKWRTFTLYSKQDPYWLIVGEREDIRRELVHHISRDHIVPQVIFIPLFALSVWLLVSLGFKPLVNLVQHVKSQDYNNLKNSLVQGSPSEISALNSALNDLFVRLNDSYARENRFASDAAHEFKTPLAALVIHVDDLLDSTQDPECRESLFNIKMAAQQLSHLVNQLLALSRGEANLDTKVNINLQGLCLECFDQFESAANKKDQTLLLDLSPKLKEHLVLGNEVLLNRAISNLLDNAIRYTPIAGSIKLSCHVNKGNLELCVEDSGPGIRSAMREQVLQRFFRIKGSGQSGSGLGLAIVKQATDYHGAKLKLASSELGGLKASIVFNIEK